VDTQAAGLAAEYPLLPNLNLHAGYTYQRQRVNRAVPLATNMDRNQFTLGLFYQAHEYKF
jgi:predicted porin